MPVSKNLSTLATCTFLSWSITRLWSSSYQNWKKWLLMLLGLMDFYTSPLFRWFFVICLHMGFSYSQDLVALSSHGKLKFSTASIAASTLLPIRCWNIGMHIWVYYIYILVYIGAFCMNNCFLLQSYCSLIHFRYLDHNQFSGRIPDAFYKHPFLKDMWVSLPEGGKF